MNFKELTIKISLIVIILIVSVDYIFLQHLTRKEFAELQTLLNEENELNTEWGKLQIEHSTFVANPRIDKKAKNELGMHIPVSSELLQIKR